jgi:sugar-specific transcriptional regulator TrmB
MDKTKQKEVQNLLYTSLKELDLTDLEINLYSISLLIGPSPISVIAKHLNISRPNVYKIIKTLENHSLAKFSEKGKYSRTFMVESPTVILNRIRAKKETLGLIDHQIVNQLPDLLALYQQGGKETQIKIIQGKEQYLKIFKQSVEESKQAMEFLGSAKDFIGFISWQEENNWIKKRIKKGLLIRSLILPSVDADTLKSTDDKQLRETRILATQTPFVTSFQLFANKIIIWQPKAPLAVLIEDRYIVDMFKTMFYCLWDISK